VGVGLQDRGSNPEEARGEDHRTADVSARAENEVRLPSSQDPQAGHGGGRVAGEGAEELQAHASGQSLDGEPVEVQPGLVRQPLLDGIRPTGERDARASALKRLGDRERGQDVPCRPAGGDEERRLWPLLHG
jgi:hypothetical protein